MIEVEKRKELNFLFNYVKDNDEAIKELEILNSIDENLLRTELSKIGINMKYMAISNILFPGDGEKSINLCLKLYCGINKYNEGISYYICSEGINDFGQSFDKIKEIIINSIPNEKLNNYICFLMNKECEEIENKIEKYNNKINYYSSIINKRELINKDNEINFFDYQKVKKY